MLWCLLGISFESSLPQSEKANRRFAQQAWRTGKFSDGGWEEIRFVTRVEDGKVVLSNGRALMKCAGLKSRL